MLRTISSISLFHNFIANLNNLELILPIQMASNKYQVSIVGTPTFEVNTVLRRTIGMGLYISELVVCFRIVDLIENELRAPNVCVGLVQTSTLNISEKGSDKR